MNKQAQLRQTRKLRRNIGAPPRTRLMVVRIEETIAVFYYRNGSVMCGEYSPNPKLRFAIRELVMNDLYDRGFAPLQGGTVFFRAGITLKDLHRLFPKTKIQVLPNTQ